MSQTIPKWLYTMRQQNPGLTFELDSDVLSFLRNKSISAKPKYTVDLSPVPSNITLRGTMSALTEVVFKGGTQKTALHLCIASNRSQNIPKIQFERTFSGALTLSAEMQGHIDVFGLEHCGSISIDSGSYILKTPEPLGVVTVTGGSANGSVNHLRVGGGTDDDPIYLSEFDVGTIELIGDSVVSLRGTRFNCTELISKKSPVKLTILNSGGNAPNSFGGPLSVETVSGMRIATVNSELEITGEAKNLVIEPNSRISFEELASGDSIEFLPSPTNRRHSQISALQGATLTRISGTVIVHNLRGAYADGGKKGFTIHDIKLPVLPTGKDERDISLICAGASIRNFYLPDSDRASTILDRLTTAETISPHTKNLPGSKRLVGSNVPKDIIARHRQAALMRKLREVTHEKGAPGSVRTKVGWCAQRLHHATARGPVEWATLFVYRLLGYGERAIPALLCWVLLATVFAISLHYPFALELSSYKKVATSIVDQAVGPVGSITNSDSESFKLDHNWQYLVRAVIAVPLVVGVLSLRNYVRTSK